MESNKDHSAIHAKKKRKRQTSGQPKSLDKKKEEDRADAKKNKGRDTVNNTSNKRKINKVLNGLTLAITVSTSANESNKSNIHDDNSSSENGHILAHTQTQTQTQTQTGEEMTYKKACTIAEELGAKTTAQVHNRVFAVICNESAIQQSTQRVRKALKKYIPLIHVKWLQECKARGQRIDHKEYILTDDAQLVVTNREQIAKDALALAVSSRGDNQSCQEVNVMDESDEEILNAAFGWSEPISLDCCCVCHDDDRDDCKWCSGDEKCNIIRMKLGLTSNDP